MRVNILRDWNIHLQIFSSQGQQTLHESRRQVRSRVEQTSSAYSA